MGGESARYYKFDIRNDMESLRCLVKVPEGARDCAP